MLHQHHLLVGKFAFPPLSRRLTAYQASILLRTAHAVLFYYTIPHSHGQPLLRKVFLMDGAAGGLSPRQEPETRRAACSSPSSGSPILSGRRLQDNDAIPGRSHDLSACAGLPAPGCKSKPPADRVSGRGYAHENALRAASAPFFMRSGAPSYDYKILSPYNYSVCF